MKSLGQEPSEQELAKMVLLADADGSGDIDFCEFVTLVAHKMRDEDNSKQKKRMEDAFAVFVRARHQFAFKLTRSHPHAPTAPRRTRITREPLTPMRCVRSCTIWEKI